MSKKRGINEAFLLNQATKNFYNNKIRLLATNMFQWEGLPNSIPERFIENTLYRHGLMGFVEDKTRGLICCKCNISGTPNLYDEGIRYNLYADNGYNETFEREDVVLLRNNKDEIPTLVFTDYYIKKLFEIDRTIDVNVILQKTSKIITCDESQKLTMQNLFMQYEGNVPFIWGYKNLDTDVLKSVDLDTPYVADKMQELKENIWRDFLNTMGINNANTTKKERLVTDEVNSNNQLLQLASDTFLESRQKACDELNERYGNKYDFIVSVKRRYDNGELYSRIGETD